MKHNGRLEAVSAVLLDMDGTLVDSDAAVERAWSAWAAEYDLDPAAVLAMPVLGAINLHPSMLPAYRGASPIQSAIADGAQTTGVTIIAPASPIVRPIAVASTP